MEKKPELLARRRGLDWAIWIVFVTFLALAVTFLTGHGSGLCDRRDHFCGCDRDDHFRKYGVQAAVTGAVSLSNS